MKITTGRQRLKTTLLISVARNHNDDVGPKPLAFGPSNAAKGVRLVERRRTGMDRSSEAQAWRRIETAQRRIRGRVFCTGMAGRYHIGKGTDIAEDPRLIERYVEPLDGEREAQAYIEASVRDKKTWRP
jgi:hypothetical protein